jgi:hypothetical protein
MADGTTSEFEGSSFIPIIVTERSEESCKCCHELKLESTRTLFELKSVLKTIKILQDDNAKWTGCKHKSADELKSNQNDPLVQNNEMEGEWMVVISNRYKNTRRTVMKNPQLPIKTVNRYEALQNTEKRTSATQYPGIINKRGIILNIQI